MVFTVNADSEALVTGWMSYLTANPSSPLVLTCLNTVLGSLKDDQYSTALKVLECALQAYFKRQFVFNHYIHFFLCKVSTNYC